MERSKSTPSPFTNRRSQPQLNSNSRGGLKKPLRRWRIAQGSLFGITLLLIPVIPQNAAEAQVVPRSRTARLRQTWAEPSVKNHQKSSKNHAHNGGCDDAKKPPAETESVTVAAKGKSPRRKRKVRRSSRPQKAKRNKTNERSLAVAMAHSDLPPAWSPEKSQKATTKKPHRSSNPPKKSTQKIHLPRQVSGGHRGGARCLAFLQRHEVPFKKAKKRGHIKTSIELTGPIGNIHLKSKWKKKDTPVMDCILAKSLLLAAPILRKHKVKTLTYTSVYRRPRRRYHPSRHSYGLAIDVRDITFTDGVTVNVQKDWKRAYGRPKSCVGRYTTDNSVRMRRIICDLEEKNIFRRILTPDSDAAHRDHFHISAGKPGEKWRRSRWAGRNLYQPLPGTRLYTSWHHWYRCYKYRSRRSKSKCYRARTPSWVVSGNPYKFKTRRYQKYLGTALASQALHRPKKRPQKNPKKTKNSLKKQKKNPPRKATPPNKK